jgi:RNA polymerase sigma-70 factor, ECF subfamily
MTETEAIEQLRRGNMGGLEPLMQAYYYQAVQAAYFITHDKVLAEDLVQSAFIRVYECIGQFDSNRAFRPWFMRIVTNDALKAISRRPPTISTTLYEAQTGAIAGELAEELLEQVETRQELWVALQQLTPIQRKAVVERYFLGLSESEMAQQNAASPQAIKTRLHSARTRLRNLISPKPEPEPKPERRH